MIETQGMCFSLFVFFVFGVRRLDFFSGSAESKKTKKEENVDRRRCRCSSRGLGEPQGCFFFRCCCICCLFVLPASSSTGSAQRRVHRSASERLRHAQGQRALRHGPARHVQNRPRIARRARGRRAEALSRRPLDRGRERQQALLRDAADPAEEQDRGEKKENERRSQLGLPLLSSTPRCFSTPTSFLPSSSPLCLSSSPLCLSSSPLSSQGVTKGFYVQLRIVGIGYRAALSPDGSTLTLKLGHSHDCAYVLPPSLKAVVPEPTLVGLWGLDKNQVTQAAANVIALRKPSPYKGKGVRVEGTSVKLKPGKRK